MVFADTSAIFALMSEGDASHGRAAACKKTLVTEGAQLWTSTHILQELWMLIDARSGGARADEWLTRILAAGVSTVGFDSADVVRALAIADDYADQDFSLADRLSFVLLERLGRSRVWTYDSDFAVYRFGPDRTEAFTIVQ